MDRWISAALRGNGDACPRYGGHGRFEERMAAGQRGEQAVAEWLLTRFDLVVPLADLPAGTMRGPQLSTQEGTVIAPDLLVIRRGRARLAEVKTKSGFTFHHHTGDWLTGIGSRDLARYEQAAEASRLPFWLLLLHLGDDDAPGDTPSPAPGLYAQQLGRLARRVHHRDSRHGMSFWRVDDLQHVATLVELGLRAAEPASARTDLHFE